MTNSTSGALSTSPLLSKSAFVAAYDCPVRLAHRCDGLLSNKSEDDFLRLLAEGGFQFEALVRKAFPGKMFERESRDAGGVHAMSVAALRAALVRGEGTLHQPTFIVGGFRARIDMLRVRNGRIELCEIKAKSFAGPVGGWDGGEFVSCHMIDDGAPRGKQRQITGAKGGVNANWIPYIADVGFQLVVLERVLLKLQQEGLAQAAMRIVPCLVLVNKRANGSALDSRANVTVVPEGPEVPADERGAKEWRFVKDPGDGWRSPLIVIVDVAEAVRLLRAPTDGKGARSGAVRWKGLNLDEMMDDAAAIYRRERLLSDDERKEELSWDCRGCEYKLNGGGGDEDGFDRCWGDGAASARSLMTLYYGGNYKDPLAGEGDWVQIRVEGRPIGTTLGVRDLEPEQGDGAWAVRRTRQITAERTGEVFVDGGLASEVQQKLRPARPDAVLYFIDFETSTSCLPHYAGDRPYQVVPFQFSCHAVPVRGGVPKWDQAVHHEWLFDHAKEQASIDLDREFVDKLSDAVRGGAARVVDSDSAVFHWAVHERTVLRQIRERITVAAQAGDAERIAFLDTMVGQGDGKKGGRLVDMLKVAERNVFHPLQKGRFSMKLFLPAICSDPEIRRLIEGLVGELKVSDSPNGTELWDPYKQLRTPGECLDEGTTLEGRRASEEDDESENGGEAAVASGTDAIRAFAALRYDGDGTGKAWDEGAKKDLRKALLTYCKLDTAAMVAVWKWLDKVAVK